MRLSSEDTNYRDENAMNSSVSPVKTLSSKDGGPFHDDSFNAFVTNLDNHNSTSRSSVFGK